MTDPTAGIRKAMIISGMPFADLAEALRRCCYCGKELYEFEGVLCARDPDPGAASAICKQAPSGPDPEHPLYPVHAIQVWRADELQKHFEVLGFAAPYAAVIRKSDGQLGSLEFTHSPRIYFNFVPDKTKADKS
jgi:hypothetical protein